MKSCKMCRYAEYFKEGPGYMSLWPCNKCPDMDNLIYFKPVNIFHKIMRRLFCL